MRDGRRNNERILDGEIIRHIKRFGPLSTRQIADGLGVANHALLSRLQAIEALACTDKDQTKFWRYTGD